MGTEELKEAVIKDLHHRLSITANFEGWSWGDRSNRLEISLLIDDVAISTIDLCIEPVGFKRDYED